MAFGYRYALERQKNGWWLVRFPAIPEALTEGETQEEARASALDCVIAALEGYMKAGKLLPKGERRTFRTEPSGPSVTRDRKIGRLRNDALPRLVEGQACQ